MKTINGYTNVEIESFIRIKLKTDINWAKRAVIVIYHNQLPYEKRTHVSSEENNIGFNRFDAPMLSSIAAKIMQKKKLTIGEEKLLLEKMHRYSKQIIQKSNKEMLTKHLNVYYKRG